MSVRRPTVAHMTLPIRHRMALRLAGATYRYEGAREADALEMLGYTPTRFRQVIGRLLDDPQAMAEEPTVVGRLRRLREVRRRARAAACTRPDPAVYAVPTTP